MSDFNGQYNSPETQIVPEKLQNAGNLTDTMLRYLKEASPWLRFMGVVGFIFCGFIALGAFFSLIGTVATSAFASEFGDIPIQLLTFLYTVILLGSGVILFFMSLFTFNFGNGIRKYQFSNSDEDLETAFKNNKSLWKFYGIMTIIYLALFPVMVIVMIAVGVAMASNMLF
ncbi:MAG: DUF5362 family protein [Treponema sp.]|nr:DUF5362 family protein [Treponema sp.]